MINLLYPWIYYDMAAGGGGGDEGGGDEGGGGGEDEPPKNGNGGADVELPADILAVQQVEPVTDVSSIPGNKYISSFTILSPIGEPLIGGYTEGSVPSGGGNILANVIGNPGGKFYLNIKDIDDDEIFDLSNVTIPVSGKYTASIAFPKSNTTNKYKINLRPGDGTRINTSFPTTDPMWTIHQYTNPTITFAKATGTATGVTYTGDDATFTAAPRTLMNRQTNSFQSTSLNNGTSISAFGTIIHAVTAAKGGALVYIKATDSELTNSTVVDKRVVEEVVNSDVVRLNNVIDLSVGMRSAVSSYTKTKRYSISSTVLRLSNTSNLEVGMFLSGTGGEENVYITSINSITEIEISETIDTNDTEPITFTYPASTAVTIKSIDTDINRITLTAPTNITLKDDDYTVLSFKNDEMRFAGATVASNSGSASTTLTNTITLHSFGTTDVTFTLPTDDIFTLTPNAYDQYVNVVKETAIDINVLALDSDDNVGSKTPSQVKDPAKGIITGGFGSGDGTITYTPNTGLTGKDSFTFKVNDGTTDSDIKTVFITINK